MSSREDDEYEDDYNEEMNSGSSSKNSEVEEVYFGEPLETRELEENMVHQNEEEIGDDEHQAILRVRQMKNVNVLKKNASAKERTIARQRGRVHKYNHYVYQKYTQTKWVPVMNEDTIRIAIDILNTSLQRINENIKPIVAQTLVRNYIYETSRGVQQFIQELALYLTVIDSAKEVRFNVLINELLQPTVNTGNVVMAVSENVEIFADNVIGQKIIEIQSRLYHLNNPTARRPTRPTNIIRLKPLKEIVLYTPSPKAVPTIQSSDEVHIEQNIESEYEGSDDFIFFMDILDDLQRQKTAMQLDQIRKGTKANRVTKKPRKKTGYQKIKEDVERTFRLKNKAKKMQKVEEDKMANQEEKAKREKEEKKANEKEKPTELKKRGRPAGKGGGKDKKTGGKQFSPYVPLMCSECNVSIAEEIHIQSIQQHVQDKISTYDKVQFCSWNCLDKYNFKSKKMT